MIRQDFATVSLHTSWQNAAVASVPGIFMVRKRTINWALSTAASLFQLFCKSRAWAASEGVKAQSCTRPFLRNAETTRCAALETATRRKAVGISPIIASMSLSRELNPSGTVPSSRPNGSTKNFPSSDPPSVSARSAFNNPSTSGCRAAISEIGTARCGPISSLPLRPTETSLSPPSPMVRTSMALTMVRQPPTSAPSAATCGLPLCKKPTSVVVPPMSDMMKSSSPESHLAPTRLAAGPDSTVSMGRIATLSASASVPSPFMIISGQTNFKFAMARSTAAINLEICAMSLAFSTAVKARRGASRALESSLDNVTGNPVNSATKSRALISCALLRTANVLAMANAPTLPFSAAMPSRNATSSNVCACSPLWSCPPATRKIGKSAKAVAMPVRTTILSSKPIRITATLLPWPSTTALVASVVDTLTKPIRDTSRSGPSCPTAFAMASPTPTERSPFVVKALADARMRCWPRSITTASV